MATLTEKRPTTADTISDATSAPNGPDSCEDFLPPRSKETVHDGGPSAWESEVFVNSQDGREGQVRRHPRYLFQHPVLAIPVLPDNSPDWDHRLIGTAVDLSCEGIGLELNTPADLRFTAMVLVFSQADGHNRFAGFEIRHAGRAQTGRLRLGGRFAGFGHELLHPHNLTPKFHPERLEFGLAFSEELLDAWARIGVLSVQLCDRVHLCPKCHALPSFREGCPRCGSARIANEQLIHHFACAHVGWVTDFEVGGDLVCPKCRTRHLVVGADYEYLTGPYHCQDCHWSDVELELVAQCLRCGFRFPGRQAYRKELKGYRAHRLDVLDLLSAPRPATGFPARTPADRHTPICTK